MDIFFDIFVFLVFGTVVGIISGFFGIGGGSVVVPTMIFMGYSKIGRASCRERV